MRRFSLLAIVTVAVAAPMPAAAFVFDDSRDDNRLVCRRDREKILGSNMRAPRTCRTRAEWREIEEHTQNETQQIRDGQEPIEPQGFGAGRGGSSGPN